MQMRKIKLRRVRRKLVVFWMRLLRRELAARGKGEDFMGADDSACYWLNL